MYRKYGSELEEQIDVADNEIVSLAWRVEEVIADAKAKEKDFQQDLLIRHHEGQLRFERQQFQSWRQV